MAWTFKIVGACLILAGAVLFGVRYRNYLYRRCVLLDSIHKTLKMIREKIVHENELLEDSMIICGKSYPVPEGNLFACFAESMETMDSPQDRWKEYVSTYLKKYGIYTEPLMSSLHEFGEAWQHVSSDSVASSMESTCKILETEMQVAEEKRQKEGGLILKISLAVVGWKSVKKKSKQIIASFFRCMKKPIPKPKQR